MHSEKLDSGGPQRPHPSFEYQGDCEEATETVEGVSGGAARPAAIDAPTFAEEGGAGEGARLPVRVEIFREVADDLDGDVIGDVPMVLQICTLP